MSEAVSTSETLLLERAGPGKRAPYRLGAWVGWGWGGAEGIDSPEVDEGSTPGIYSEGSAL